MPSAAWVLAASLVAVGAMASAQPSPSAEPLPASQLYRENCAGCHGTVVEQGGRAPNLFNPQLLAARSDEQLAHVIRAGVPGSEMPAFADVLGERDPLRIAAYLRSEARGIREKPPFVPDPHGQVVRSQKQTFRVETVARGLDTPWGLAFLPDGRALVTERSGRLRIIRGGKLLPQPVKGTPQAWVRQDAGMMDVAVHPDYARNGWIYLAYAELAPGDSPTEPGPDARQTQRSMTVIVRGKLNVRNEWVQNQVVFRAPAALYTTNNSHYGCRLAFDREGHLFFSIGDRGAIANSQDLANPLGKIHRVNDDGTVPANNPFVGRPRAFRSIWSYGHRNPQGLSWDPRTGLLWESEHGPNGGDEINIVEKGKNYGWGVVTMGVQQGISLREAPGMEQPIVHYTPRIAPSGITFYTGNRYPGWKNDLFVAALAGQQLRRLRIDGRQVTEQEVVYNHLGRTRAAVIGPDGLFYILLQNPTGAGTGIVISDPSPGSVIRLVPLPASTR